MAISGDSLMGFYIIGAIMVLVLTMFAFIAKWSEQKDSFKKKR